METLIRKIDMGYQLDKRDVNFLKFAYKALFYDCSKMLILFLFALATHRGAACLLDLFLLAGLRSNHGGIHLKHYWSCFAMSFAVLIFSFAMPMLVTLQKPAMLAALLLCMFINYLIGPLRSKQCHVKDTSIFKKNQIRTFAIVLIYLISLYLLPASYTLVTGFWIIITHSAQLIVAKCIKNFTERRNTNEKTDTKITQTT